MLNRTPSVGDIVRIHNEDGTDTFWPESEGEVALVVEMAKRLHNPAAKVLVLGDIAEWDLDELEVINESR